MQATANKEVTAILVLRGSGIFREKRYSAVTAMNEVIPCRREEKQPPFKKSSKEMRAVAFGCTFHAVTEILRAVFDCGNVLAAMTKSQSSHAHQLNNPEI